MKDASALAMVTVASITASALASVGDTDVIFSPAGYAVPADARLFSYNTVLGPIIQIPYDQQNLIDGVSALGVGSVRYSGGTVADYWQMSRGNYVSPCNKSLCSCCEFENAIAAMPAGTFGPKAVLAEGSLGRATVSTPVFDVNVLTLNSSEAVADIRFLATQVSTPDDVQLFELGNEFYLPGYRWRFPTSVEYMEAAAPVIAEGRKEFPDALVLAVADQGQLYGGNSGCGSSSWNNGVKNRRELFDGVTPPDYSIQNKSVTKNYPRDEWYSVVASWSSASVINSVQGVQSCFGDDTLIAQTEYNYAGGTGNGFGPNPSGPLLYPYGAIHGIFQAVRILEAAYHTVNGSTPDRARARAQGT